MCNGIKLCSFVRIVGWLFTVCIVAAYKGWGKRWATVEQEAKDELHDAEILRAVQESMAAWTQRRSSHRYVYVFFREIFYMMESLLSVLPLALSYLRLSG